MWIQNYFKSLSSTPTRRRPIRRRPSASRLWLEALEDRSLPSCMVSLAPSEAAPQLVGEGITWTPTAADCRATPIYHFSVAPHAGALPVVRDFSPTNAFPST